MASSRPSAFKKGGGFLNNVAGVISDYEFTDTFPGTDGPKDGAAFNPLYFVLSADVDGAEKTAQTTLFAGSADDFEISKDGKTLTPVDDSVGIRATSQAGAFIAALCAPENGDGFPEENLPDEGEDINYEAIIGTRVNFIQVKDEAAMKKAAKNWRKSGGKFNEQGQKKAKDGDRYYDQTYTSVDAVLALPDEKPAKGSKSAKGGKPQSTKSGRPAKEAEVDLEAIATETLLELLADNDDSLEKSKLPGLLVKKLGVKHPHREEVRKLIYSDDFLEGQNGWTYDKKSKKQTISLA